ncbi:MAG TPA: hypothetical protein VMW17_02890 [Candidatus Binatia bacterium]|nr:hypothetical protein [Candidatus Binatia bacterium]
MALWTIVVWLWWLSASAQAQPASPPSFGYFTCVCQVGNPLQNPTPSILAPTITSWRGTVYALSDTDARMKAKSACVAENHGSTPICDSCFCKK